MWLTVILATSTLLLFLFYNKRRRAHLTLQECGIPGPEPHWLFGNLKGIDITNDPLILKIHKWTQTYGKIYGYYEGSRPIVVVSDPDMVQELYVRQFSVFHGRKRFALQADPQKAKRISMFLTEGERWKRLRSIINPAFTESKMRMMYPLIKVSIDQLLDMLKREASSGQPVDIYEFYKRMTLDVISQCAFGVDLDTQNEPTNSVYLNLKNIFDVQFGKRPWLVVLAEIMSELRPVLIPIIDIMGRLIPSRRKRLLILDEMDEVIKHRRQSPESRRVDILQLLLDAESEDTGKAEGEPDKPKKKALTTEELQAQVLMFLFAGYETSSTALGYITHSIATHPEVQERLKAEVDALYEELGEAAETSYERLGSLDYMNNVIHETLRYYPIAPIVVARRCSKTIQIGKYTIPKDSSILTDMYALHFNPDLWGPIDPKQFNPDRFEGNPKRHPAAWIPFGIGPRFCVGQRFAMMEIRATLLRILRNFNIKPSAKTKVPIEIKYGPTITPKGELFVQLEPRSDHTYDA